MYAYMLQEIQDICVICQNGFDTTRDRVTLREKGCLKINSISDKFGDDIHAVAGNYVHFHCRQQYTHTFYISSRTAGMHTPVVSPRKRRPSAAAKCDKKDFLCLLCNEKTTDLRKGTPNSAHKLIPVWTLECKNTLLRFCKERGQTDKWSRDVKGKIEYMQDLYAHDAVYHNICYSNFRKGQQIPQMFSTGEPASKKVCPGLGRPKNILSQSIPVCC